MTITQIRITELKTLLLNTKDYKLYRNIINSIENLIKQSMVELN